MNTFRSSRTVTVRHYSSHLNPDYNPQNLHNDLMIIQIRKQRFQFPDPPPLLTEDNIPNKTAEYLIQGFGINFPNIRKRAAPLALHMRKKRANELYFTQADRGSEKPHPVCGGDSGAPIYTLYPDQRIEVLAVTSAILTKRKGPPLCNPRQISVHSWLYPHLEWIESFL